jgi:hypothetical protein
MPESDDAARKRRRDRALNDPQNYERYLKSREDLEWWESEGRARAAR